MKGRFLDNAFNFVSPVTCCQHGCHDGAEDVPATRLNTMPAFSAALTAPASEMPLTPPPSKPH